MAKENRNIHFMNVITEYFPISGLNIPRYKEKLSVFRMSINIPKGVVSVVLSIETLLIIKYMMPAKLMATPPAFCKVIGSFSTMAAIIIVYIGDMADSIEQSIGVMWGIPIRNVSWHVKNPNSDAVNILI